MTRLSRVVVVALTLLLGVSLSVATSDAKPAKGKGRRPPPSASATTRLRGVQSAPLQDAGLLGPPATPQSPPFPRPPQPPSSPSSARLSRAPLDVDSECRQTCNSKRSQCITQQASLCDGAWSTCVINCNLPSVTR